MNTNTEKKTAVFTVRGKGRDKLPTRKFAPFGSVNVELTTQQFRTIIDAINGSKRIYFTFNTIELLRLEASLKSDFKTVTLAADASLGLGAYAEGNLTPCLTSPRFKRMIDRYEILNRLNRIKAARRAKAALRKNVKCPKCGTEFSVKNG